MKYHDTFSDHVKSPDISVEDYVRRKRIALANDFQHTKKIYLDTKFWVLFRDERLGRNSNPGKAGLLELIENLVAEGKAVCPISASTYLEIFSQKDPTTLQASVLLIDDLSLGLTLIEEGERFRLEFVHFVKEKLYGSDAVFTLDHLVWTKLAYALGFVTPRSENLPPDVDLALQKAFADHMWDLTLADVKDVIGDGIQSFPRKRTDVSSVLLTCAQAT